MILEKNEVQFAKIGARVLDLWLDMSSGPSYPNVVSTPQSSSS